MNRRLFVFILFNLLVLIGALCVSIYAQASSRRYFENDVIFIAPRLNEAHLLWNMDDINTLERTFPNFTISAESRGSISLSSSIRNATTTVVFCNAPYFDMHFMEFISGGLGLEGTNSIVLNEWLAWRLFGATDVAGQLVEINEVPYIVAGVVRQEHHYLAWLLHSSGLAEATQLPVTALYIRAHYYNVVDAMVASQEMLTSLGRSIDNYSIVNINRFVESFAIRVQLLIYILWLYVFYIVSLAVFKRAGELPNYRMHLGRHIGRWCMYLIFPIVGMLVSGYILYMGINDILQWLPTIGTENIFTSISNVGVLPPDGYLSFGLQRLSVLNRMINVAWVVAIITFINLFFCTGSYN